MFCCLGSRCVSVRQELGPLLGKAIYLGDGGRSGPLADVTRGHRLRKGSEGPWCSCVFWLEGALDLAQIFVWQSRPFDSSSVTGRAAVSKLYLCSANRPWDGGQASRRIGPDRVYEIRQCCPHRSTRHNNQDVNVSRSRNVFKD